MGLRSPCRLAPLSHSCRFDSAKSSISLSLFPREGDAELIRKEEGASLCIATARRHRSSSARETLGFRRFLPHQQPPAPQLSGANPLAERAAALRAELEASRPKPKAAPRGTSYGDELKRPRPKLGMDEEDSDEEEEEDAMEVDRYEAAPPPAARQRGAPQQPLRPVSAAEARTRSNIHPRLLFHLPPQLHFTPPPSSPPPRRSCPLSPAP